jgi:restriction endonuclease S subunit
LSDEQIKNWKETLEGVEIKNGSKIEKRYQELQKAEPKVALQILASFDTKNALQMDIAREYFSKLDKKAWEQNEKLVKLFELLKETKVFPFESLGALIIQKENKIKLQDDVLYKQVTIKLYGKGVLVRQEVMGAEIKTEAQFVVNAGDFIMSKIDARNGAFGVVPEILEGAVVTTSFPYFEVQTNKVNPKYLESIVTQKSFYDQINNMVSGATGRRSVEVDNFLELQIPFPPLEVQNEIVEKIKKQKQIIDGAERIDNAHRTSLGELNFETKLLSNICQNLDGRRKPITEEDRIKGDIPYFGASGVIDYVQDYIFDEDLLLVSEDGANLKMRTYPIAFSIKGKTWINNHAHVLKFNDRITQKFVEYYLNSISLEEYLTGTTQPKLNQEKLNNIPIPLPPLETQRQIVEKLDKQMQALEGVRLLKSEAEKRIEEILAGVWGKND